jgi:hypothetical protein
MSYGILVKINEDFSIVRETLARIGIINKKTKTVYPSCYIVGSMENDNLYKILHFKEMFMATGGTSDISEDDILRRNTIVLLLKKWKLVDPINNSDIIEYLKNPVSVLPHKEKKNYTIVHKFKFPPNTKLLL